MRGEMGIILEILVAEDKTAYLQNQQQSTKKLRVLIKSPNKWVQLRWPYKI